MLQHREHYPIRKMCHMFDVSHSGYYAWLIRPPSKRSIENHRLLGLIKDSHQASGNIYGSPRVWLDLLEVGERVSLNRVARIMQNNKIRAQRGYKRPGYRYHKPALAAPNRLQQQFTVDHPDVAWVTDITYIRTYEGWLYLAIIMDLCSRKIIEKWSPKVGQPT